jgi:hypothetical protein
MRTITIRKLPINKRLKLTIKRHMTVFLENQESHEPIMVKPRKTAANKRNREITFLNNAFSNFFNQTHLPLECTR